MVRDFTDTAPCLEIGSFILNLLLDVAKFALVVADPLLGESISAFLNPDQLLEPSAVLKDRLL